MDYINDLIAYLKLQANERRWDDETWAACNSDRYPYIITYGRLRELITILERFNGN